MDTVISESIAITTEQAASISTSDFTALLESWIKYSITEEEEALQVSTLLYSLFGADRGDLVEMFIERMEKEYNVADYSYLCKIITFSMHANVMLFLSSVVSMEFYHLMYGLAVIKDDTLIAHALANINVLFPNAEDIDTEALQKLMPRMMEAQNYQLVSFIDTCTMIAETGVAEVPTWIIQTDEEVTEEELISSLKFVPGSANVAGVTVEDNVEYLLDIAQRENSLIDLEDLRNSMLETARADPLAWRDTVNSMVENEQLLELEHDTELFRVLGGCLKVPNGVTLSQSSADVCQRWGGCRAITCYHHENWDRIEERPIYEDPVYEGVVDDRGDTTDLEWFTGQCRNCYKLITKKCYAARMPMEQGGWRGCYCSFTCVRDDTDLENDVRNRLVNRAETMYNAQGIYDRI